MGIRRKARELALQCLYLIEFNNLPYDVAFKQFSEHFEVRKKSMTYAEELILGVRRKKDAINELISTHAENWRPERMSLIDRNIIRLAVFEMCFKEDVPARVAINEAIEIAKRYGNDESGQFINGILDAIHKSIQE